MLCEMAKVKLDSTVPGRHGEAWCLTAAADQAGFYPAAGVARHVLPPVAFTQFLENLAAASVTGEREAVVAAENKRFKRVRHDDDHLSTVTLVVKDTVRIQNKFGGVRMGRWEGSAGRRCRRELERGYHFVAGSVGELKLPNLRGIPGF
jgi:hypothetical protein